MIRQLLKSAFWDGWDNLVPMVAGNAAFAALAALWYLAAATLASPWLALLAQGAVGALAFAHACALAGMFARGIAAVGRGGAARAYLDSARRAGPTGLVAGFLSACVTGFLILALPFWLAMGALGIVAVGLALWASVWALLALAWVPAVCAATGSLGLAAFKKALSATAGNPGLTLFLALYNLVTLALSLPLAMLLPGPAGTVMAGLTALRLDLLRYRWLVDAAESRGDGLSRAEMRAVPWAQLLKDERERMAGRRLRDALGFRGGDR